ncbi:MAG TPA: glycerol-3-phosphate dehydrogenase [Steroidobacteraceae bacterium]|nr:glycerol-3-phosphate dehydrogenase [Steroidobacteraceae bacterium]
MSATQMRQADARRPDCGLFDLVVVGGGINGVGIARDAAGRGLEVLLLERHDLAGATSSASSKLIHGGLRYLEQGEFRLVRESLSEREVIWRAAPHVVRPLRFVLPVHSGLRPSWVLRTGLFIYDHIGGRKRLPPTRTLRRGRDAALDPLRERFQVAFEYSDCWADDARLVVLNALDARERGAAIAVGWSFLGAHRESQLWRIELESERAERRSVRARALVNAAGPWVEQVLERAGAPRRRGVRLVKGSHIVVPRVYAGEHAYTFQSGDGRVVFAIPFEGDFTLVGTTDVPYGGDPGSVRASDEEVAYLCRVTTDYFRTTVSPPQVAWRYSGVRPLYDDGDLSASTVTRDYVFDLDAPTDGAPILSIFGGKLTTYRRLAEHALADLLPRMRLKDVPWTRAALLPGGDLPGGDLERFTLAQALRYAFAPAAMIRRMCRAYGTRIERILGNARRIEDLGAKIAPRLFEAELEYLRAAEWARSAEDVLWRRSKLGLVARQPVPESLDAWFANSAAHAREPGWLPGAGKRDAGGP